MYAKQTSWIMLERDLREKTCQLIVQAVVPVYRSYMQNYGPLVEQDAAVSTKYAKYTVQKLEEMLLCLYRPRPVRHGSLRSPTFSAKYGNGVPDLRRTASAVV